MDIFLTYKQNLLHLEYLRNDYRSSNNNSNNNNNNISSTNNAANIYNAVQKARLTRQASIEDVLG